MINDEKETDTVVFVRGFRMGRLELFPFQFSNPACVQSRAQGHFGFLSLVWLPGNIIWRLYR